MQPFLFTKDQLWIYETRYQGEETLDGVTYWVLSLDIEAWWLLNYRGGSFAFPHSNVFEKELKTRGVSYEVIPDAAFNRIVDQISQPEVNKDVMKLNPGSWIHALLSDHVKID